MPSPSENAAAGSASTPEMLEVNLRIPEVAAVLGWLWPGAGHLYQRRYAKGFLFMTCILGIFFFGLALGDGHVVYASFTKADRRWQYLCQLGVGAPALPALVQSRRVIRDGKEPLWHGFMAPPFPVRPEGHDELAEWHREYNQFFELGTLYTMVAGLMNVLAIYDAFAGPMVPPPEEDKKKKRKRGTTEPAVERPPGGVEPPASS